ncbi:hypothetical protein AVEN_184141-1 [Araneus ventricosus]|uniref:Uncharacterized protein n=1 Tax=Araneus ventricosus TaxID=182803 RepID=A0A4Y2RUY5_ARAVE|nr:hypothetical protein AVEN_184141-1 [Araneus ventricosus]
MLWPRAQDMICHREQDILWPMAQDILWSMAQDMLWHRAQDMLCPRAQNMLWPREHNMLWPKAQDMLWPRAQDMHCPPCEGVFFCSGQFVPANPRRHFMKRHRIPTNQFPSISIKRADSASSHRASSVEQMSSRAPRGGNYYFPITSSPYNFFPFLRFRISRGV